MVWVIDVSQACASELTADSVKSMPFTEAALLEAIRWPHVVRVLRSHAFTRCMLNRCRLYPPIPIEAKCATQGDVLPDGSVVRQGTVVIYSPFVFNRSPKLWGQPDQFRPERWLQKQSMATAAAGEKPKLTQASPYKFVSFNAGPRSEHACEKMTSCFRVCLGKGIALLEAKVCSHARHVLVMMLCDQMVLATLFHKFSVK